MIKVLIADDEFIMRQGLKYIINWESEGFEIVGESFSESDCFSSDDVLERSTLCAWEDRRIE